MLTQLAPVDFDPAALAPRWQAFLEEILGGHEGLVSFVQRAVGLSLIGQVLEHVFFLSYGKGANGKTTFLAVIHGVLGDYARQADSELLLAHRDAVHPTGLADLRGARFVSSSEVEDGRRFSEATMKILTGETLRKARFMHQDFFEYTPSDTIWLAVNHKPKVQGTDEGFWRRIRALPFTVTIPPERQDRHLAERLLAEAPGILAWAVRGCLDYQARGLAPPDCVVEATTQYREEEDILGAFLQERCVVFPGLTVGATELYHDYVEWGNAAGEHPVAQTRFGIQLRERGFEKGRAQSPRDILIYRGLGLTDSTRGRDGREGPDTSAGYPLSRARVRDQFAGTHDLSLSYSETVPLDSTIPAHEHTKDRAADTEYPADTPDVPPQNGGEVIL
jgi:putative DNA primase/helicase